MATNSEFPPLAASLLQAPVRLATVRPAAEVTSWECRSIHWAFNRVTGGLYQIDGQARDQGEPLQWSLVLKIVRKTTHLGLPTDVPSSILYWKREPLLYRSGFLDNLPSGLAAPRCYGVIEPDPETAWIWLEHVADQSEPQWSAERYHAMARQLGAFNGAFLTNRPLPQGDFLSQRQRWPDAAAYASLFPHLAAARTLPIVQQTWPPALQQRIHQIDADAEVFSAALDRLPITFAHLDAFRRNLLVPSAANGDDRTVAVDWAFSGLAPVGAELAPLIGGGLALGLIQPDGFADLDRSAFVAYVEGLRSVSWEGDERLARLSYAASAAVRYGLHPTWGRAVDDAGQTVDRLGDRPIQEFLERRATIARHFCDLADEARALIGTINLEGQRGHRGDADVLSGADNVRRDGI